MCGSTETQQRLPGCGASPLSHFTADMGPGQEKEYHMAQLGKRNGNQHDFSAQYMNNKHRFIRSPLVIGQVPGNKRCGGNERKQEVIGGGDDPNFRQDDPAKDQTNGGKKKYQGHVVGGGFSQTEPAEPPPFVPEDIMTQQKNGRCEQAEMKGVRHQGKPGFFPHATTAEWDEPEKDRPKGPSRVEVIEDHLILFRGKAYEGYDFDDHTDKKNNKGYP